MAARPVFARGRASRGRIPRLASILAGLALLAGGPRAAGATVTSVEPKPSFAPTTCDSVWFHAAGVLPDPCYEIVSVELKGPLPFACIGCPTTYVVAITVRAPAPDAGIACPLVITPYEREVPVGFLAEGRYHVIAEERIIPYTPDSSGVTIDSSRVEASFQVYAAGCPPGTPCQLLDFDSPGRPSLDCDAAGAPGGRAYFDVTLSNPVRVGGLQARFDIFDLRMSPLPGGTFTPISVEPVGRAFGFQVAWTPLRASGVSVLLFSPSGAVLEAGGGPVLRIGYAIGGDTPRGRYLIAFEDAIVSDPEGVAIPHCPTFAEVTGSFCVVEPSCDLNADGGSDILDIIRLVNCALEHPSEACPDTVAARADCNHDGSIDIRDVICCVRKIVSVAPCEVCRPVPVAPLAAGAGSATTSIGFAGPAIWLNPAEARAVLDLETAAGFAGLELRIDRTGSGIRIRDLRLEGAPSSDRLEWAAGADGSIRAMLISTGPWPRPAGRARIEVDLERVLGFEGGGQLTLADVKAGNDRAEPIPTETPSLTAAIPQTSTIGAPTLFGAMPNPFRGGTEMSYALPSPARVSIRVFNVNGRLVKTLVDETRPAGIHRAAWDGRDEHGRAVGAGIYFARFAADRVERVQRLMLLR